MNLMSIATIALFTLTLLNAYTIGKHTKQSSSLIRMVKKMTKVTKNEDTLPKDQLDALEEYWREEYENALEQRRGLKWR